MQYIYISSNSHVFLFYSKYSIHAIYVIKIEMCNTCDWDRRGRDRMVVEFTTTYAISAYHH